MQSDLLKFPFFSRKLFNFISLYLINFITRVWYNFFARICYNFFTRNYTLICPIFVKGDLMVFLTIPLYPICF